MSPVLIIAFLPAFITGNGKDFGDMSPLHINDQVIGVSSDNNSDDIENITQRSMDIDEHGHEIDEKLPKEVDHFFLLIMSIIIFFMQCGFAFMEAGAVR